MKVILRLREQTRRCRTRILDDVISELSEILPESTDAFSLLTDLALEVSNYRERSRMVPGVVAAEPAAGVYQEYAQAHSKMTDRRPC